MLFGLVLLALLAATASVQASSPLENVSYGQRLILNVYLDSTGKALVTGYVDDIRGLAFLNASQYRFENETSQLYALTDGLTAKEGNLWTLRFGSSGYYDDYRVTFYLPSDMLLGRINTSEGLSYLLSASNESMVADVQGYEVHDPRIAIEYQQPLAASRGSIPVSAREGLGSHLLFAAALLAAGLILAILIIMRRKGRSPQVIPSRESARTAPPAEPPLPSETPETIPAKQEDASNEIEMEIDDEINLSRDEQVEVSPEDGLSRKEIEISSEMEAVMQTLTARERAVMTSLIDHRGRMTQAEIRYETRTPKSSLTGILISLERRKLVTKKEWGRTNIIELSEWFLSRKERS